MYNDNELRKIKSIRNYMVLVCEAEKGTELEAST